MKTHETHAERMARKKAVRKGISVNQQVEEVIVETVEKGEQQKLQQHKDSIRRMGMLYTELPRQASDMTHPKVHERITHVLETAKRCPSHVDRLNDFDLANMTRMLMREDHLHEEIVCSARTRIFKLSREKQALSDMMLGFLLGLNDFTFFVGGDNAMVTNQTVGRLPLIFKHVPPKLIEHDDGYNEINPPKLIPQTEEQFGTWFAANRHQVKTTYSGNLRNYLNSQLDNIMVEPESTNHEG